MSLRTERALKQILNLAEGVRREFPEETDPDYFYLIGGIITNAEDALGGLKAERASAGLHAMFKNGIVHVQR